MVPSRGGSDMVTGLLTGTMPMAIVGLPNFIPHIRSGAVKAIAVDSDTRSPLFPDVPTLEASWAFPISRRCISALSRRPARRRTSSQKLHDEIVAIGNDPAFRQKRLIDIGIVPVFDTTEHFADYLKVQRDNGRKLIQEFGFPAAVVSVSAPRHAAAGFLRGRNGLSGRLIAPEQARVIVLPPSVQVCVPLSLALRRTKVPLYLA